MVVFQLMKMVRWNHLKLMVIIYSGQELLDVFEYHVRKSFDEKENTDDLSTDLVWYLWTGKYSSLFW